ncbi:MAG: hypothetical protein IJR65_01890 [Oscillospiraceae bacterium]|nr:hypothetical protein [Oscillospiraceae bacterium]
MPYHYHYDRDSFLAGLAAGRALWRPPDDRAEGWTCDPAYRVYFAGTDLGSVLSRHFYKERNGLAVGVFAKNYIGSWCGPILLSTDPDAVRYYYGGTHLGQGPGAPFEYLGMTWYINSMHHFTNPSTYSYGTLLPLDCGGMGLNDYASLGRYILQAAGVRTY